MNKKHVERWYQWDLTKVKVEFETPSNYPTVGEHILEGAQALRQFALMTARIEGWEVEDETHYWHDFVDSLEV